MSVPSFVAEGQDCSRISGLYLERLASSGAWNLLAKKESARESQSVGRVLTPRLVTGLASRRSDRSAISLSVLIAVRGRNSECFENHGRPAASGWETNSTSRFQTTQAMRASLLARAMAALLGPRRRWTSRAQALRRSGAFTRLEAQRTERAPWVRSIRILESPRLLMRPSRRMLPEECSRGVRPR